MRRVICLCLFLFPSWVWGQQCTSYVVVAAYEHKLGADMENLKPDDFQVNVGQMPLAAVSAQQNFRNRLLVLVEADGAQKSDKLQEMVDVVTRWARQVPDGEPVAFGVFGKRALFTKQFFADPKERSKAISEVAEEAPTLGNRAALFDALHQGLALFGDHQPGDTVLLVSDDFDDASRHSPGDLEKEFLAKGIRLFLMLRQNPSQVGRDFLWRAHTEGEILVRTSRETGGAYSEFSPSFFRFAWAGYLVGIKVEPGLSSHRKLKVKLKGGTDFYRKAILYYPERLPPCSPGPAAP
jgi:hypothetical protein